jgi:UTP-glucose-1-phosphate uridylyltransferase
LAKVRKGDNQAIKEMPKEMLPIVDKPTIPYLVE